MPCLPKVSSQHTTTTTSQQHPYILATFLPTSRRKDSKCWADSKLQINLSSHCNLSLCRDINWCLSFIWRVDRGQVSWYPYEYIIFEISPSELKFLDVCWRVETDGWKDRWVEKKTNGHWNCVVSLPLKIRLMWGSTHDHPKTCPGGWSGQIAILAPWVGERYRSRSLFLERFSS